MRINVTINCIKLTNVEQMMLTLIKGIMYDFHHAIQGHHLYKDSAYKNVLIEVMEGDGKCVFLVSDSAPGLISEFRKLITPLFGAACKISGGFGERSRMTTIIVDRIKL